MKRIVLLLVLLLAGCRQPDGPISNPDLQITLEVLPAEPVIGDALMIVTLLDGQGQPVDDATISLRGDMSHAGMVPVLREAEGGSGGRYELPFIWTMAGDWFVEVTVTQPDGQQAREGFSFTVGGR